MFDMFKKAGRGIVSGVKKVGEVLADNAGKVVAAGTVTLGFTSAPSAHAEGTAIDTAITSLTSSGTTIAGVAGTLAAIAASVMIWGKVRKYFSKAG